VGIGIDWVAMNGSKVLLLVLCLALLVLPMLCVGHVVEHGCASCGDQSGYPGQVAADPCRTLMRLEELGSLTPPDLLQPALMMPTLLQPSLALTVVAGLGGISERVVDRWALAPLRSQLAYPESDTPLRI